MLLDYLLIGVFKLGVMGAATASLSGMLISTVGPIIYFRFNKSNLLRLGKPHFHLGDVAQSAINGMSEFVSNVSGSIVTIVFNIQLLKYIGENGVSAYGIIAYVCFVFFAIFIGYSVGIAPVIGFNFGAQNKDELTNILNKSFIIIASAGILMFVLSLALAKPFSYIFANDYPELHELTTKAMMIYSFCYLFAGFSMFGSSFFTALNNGLISAIISFCRTLVFQLGSVFIFPLFMGVDGIWFSIIVAEFLSMAMTLLFIILYRKRYGYRLLKS
jgi:Na+-driven multidrug efflux pump